ncbi:hypothetical protein GA0115252_171425, partial [Streptomyces sp. DfronAA-171]
PPHRLVRRRVHPRRRPRAAAAPFPAMTPLLRQAVPGGAGGRGEVSGPRVGRGRRWGWRARGVLAVGCGWGAGGPFRRACAVFAGLGAFAAAAWRLGRRSRSVPFPSLSPPAVPVPRPEAFGAEPPVPASRAETAGAPVHTRPRRASWGRRSTGLPECAPALRMRLVCAERAERHPRPATREGARGAGQPPAGHRSFAYGRARAHGPSAPAHGPFRAPPRGTAWGLPANPPGPPAAPAAPPPPRSTPTLPALPAPPAPPALPVRPAPPAPPAPRSPRSRRPV